MEAGVHSERIENPQEYEQGLKSSVPQISFAYICTELTFLNFDNLNPGQLPSLFICFAIFRFTFNVFLKRNVPNTSAIGCQYDIC